MKMSRSIKDYKDAMDSVEISDSFYKRTEVLLSESSVMDITQVRFSKIKVISRTVMVLAACLLVAFGVKTVADNRTETETAIVTDFGQEETILETTPAVMTESASPVINRPEEDKFIEDSGVIMDDMPPIPESEADDSKSVGTEATNPAFFTAEAVAEEEFDDEVVLEINDELTEETTELPVQTMITTAVACTETTGLEAIPALNKETDREIRSDYADYVSERDNRQVNADNVVGVYNYGTDNGYRLLVMSPSECSTEEIQEIELTCMDLQDEECDCLPYLLITLPSGTYEMVVYKDNTFIDIVTAVNKKLISYDAVVKIEAYMNLYYTEGNQMCVYKVE